MLLSKPKSIILISFGFLLLTKVWYLPHPSSVGMYTQILILVVAIQTYPCLAAAGMSDADCPVNIPGYTHHGNCNLLCAPASWVNILAFFVGNYIAHAASITSFPGESIAATALTALTALLFPSGGVVKALQMISTLALLAPTPLEQAARAGALCTVVKLSELKQPSRRALLTDIFKKLRWILSIPCRRRLPKDVEMRAMGGGSEQAPKYQGAEQFG